MGGGQEGARWERVQESLQKAVSGLQADANLPLTLG